MGATVTIPHISISPKENGSLFYSAFRLTGQCLPLGWPARKRPFLEFSLCLSRAGLGKTLAFSVYITWHRKRSMRFLTCQPPWRSMPGPCRSHARAPPHALPPRARPGTLKRSSEGGLRWRAYLQENKQQHFFEWFSDVCPEPVLVE